MVYGDIVDKSHEVLHPYDGCRTEDFKQESGWNLGFVTAGDPTPDMSMKIVLGMCRAGLDILELGVPFFDPTADGPVIQRSSERSLENGTSLSSALEMTRRIRAETPISCGPEIRRSHFPG